MRVAPMQSMPAPLRQQTFRADEEQQRIPQAAAPSTLSAMASSQTPPSGNQPPPTNGAQTPPYMQSPGSLPPVSGPQPQGRRPNWMGNVPLRWVIIGFIIIIVVASGLGILTAIARIHSTPSTHTNPACPNQQSATCKPQNYKTPVASADTVNLLFSGAVTGRLISTRFTRC